MSLLLLFGGGGGGSSTCPVIGEWSAFNMRHMGDILEDQTIRGSFNTRGASGAPITLAGTPTVVVYKDGSTTEISTGASLTVDFDSLTGYHVWTIDTSASASYTTGADYRVVLSAGTVDSISVVGVDVGSFSIQARSELTGNDINTALMAYNTTGVASAAAVQDNYNQVDGLITLVNTIPTAAENATAVANEIAADITIIKDHGGWLLAINAGAVASPQATSSSYEITINGTVYTSALAGQTDTGVRTAPSLTKV